MADEVIGEEISRTQPLEKASEAKEELANGAEIPLRPDEAAEEARKAEIRQQISKVGIFIFKYLVTCLKAKHETKLTRRRFKLHFVSYNFSS